MTHDELLQVINVYNNGKGDAFANALRAVVELHKPMEYKTFLKNRIGCEVCEDNDIYPCPTIQAIEKELQ